MKKPEYIDLFLSNNGRIFTQLDIKFQTDDNPQNFKEAASKGGII